MKFNTLFLAPPPFAPPLVIASTKGGGDGWSTASLSWTPSVVRETAKMLSKRSLWAVLICCCVYDMNYLRWLPKERWGRTIYACFTFCKTKIEWNSISQKESPKLTTFGDRHRRRLARAEAKASTKGDRHHLWWTAKRSTVVCFVMTLSKVHSAIE